MAALRSLCAECSSSIAKLIRLENRIWNSLNLREQRSVAALPQILVAGVLKYHRRQRPTDKTLPAPSESRPGDIQREGV